MPKPNTPHPSTATTLNTSGGQRSSLLRRDFLSSYPEDDDDSNSTTAHSHTPSHYVQSWVNSFRRDPGRRITPATVVHGVGSSKRSSTIAGGSSRGGGNSGSGGSSREEKERHIGGHYFDLHAANVNTANTQLSRELKGRHLQMIALGGTVGMVSLLSLFKNRIGANV